MAVKPSSVSSFSWFREAGIRTTLFLAAAATLIPAAAHAQDPCSLLTPDQIKAVVSVPVNPGQPGGTKDSPDCTWKDAKDEARVYLSRKSRDNFNVTRAQMANSGRLTSVRYGEPFRSGSLMP